MIIEENVEQFYLDFLRDNVTNVKQIDRLGLFSIDPNDPVSVESAIKIAPAIMVAVIGDDVVKNITVQGEVQALDYTFMVWILSVNLWNRKSGSDEGNVIHRQVKNLLRAKEYKPQDGNTEQTSWLEYSGRSRTIIKGLILQEQRYRLRVQDR